MNIVILGATGNIGRVLYREFIKHGDNAICIPRIYGQRHSVGLGGYEGADVIINCTGNSFIGSEILAVTEFYNNLIFEYLTESPDTIVISFSSGAVNLFDPRAVSPKDYYTIAKINAEAKHRASPYNMIDIRVYSMIDHIFKRDKPLFINEVIESLINKTTFKTNNEDMTRDYISAKDLFSLVLKCIAYRKNDVFEAYSLKPTSKFNILNEFQSKFGLVYETSDYKIDNPYSGNKPDYVPVSEKAVKIGYIPTVTSLDNLVNETELILKGKPVVIDEI